MTRRLMLYKCIKFHQNFSNDFLVLECTVFCDGDRKTNGCMHRENQMTAECVCVCVGGGGGIMKYQQPMNYVR